jgi:starch-binding outer membrane protein, SusD/RagB family
MTKLSSLRLLSSLTLLGAGLGLGACDDLLTESPPHIIVADNLYLDRAGFEAGLSALYSLAREEHQSWTGSSSVRATMWTAGTDEAFIPSAGTEYRFFNVWGVDANPSAGPFLGHWTWLYQAINAANTIIDRAENPAVRWTPAEKDQVVAEARFFRAWAYRHLTYMFGDVPLSLKESSGETVRTDWERAPVAEVRKQIEQDLLFAEAHLPETTSSTGRVVKAVPRHYLSELYLVMGSDALAEAKAKAVIDSGLYRLITQRYGARAKDPGVPFMDQFYEGNVNRSQGNTEILWAFQFQKDVVGSGDPIMRRSWLPPYERNAGIQNSVEFGGRGVHRLAATRWALNNYEAMDDRGGIYAIRWFLTYNNPASLPRGKALGDTLFLNRTSPERFAAMQDWPWPRKWEWADPLNVIGNGDYVNQPVVRLAETYLLLAEAQMKQGKLTEAAQSINVVRTRAHASPISAPQVTIDFILDERSRELLAEEQRRYTLLRTGKWLERTRKFNPLAGPNIREHHVLYPIPQAVIDANLGRKMEQNPGY